MTAMNEVEVEVSEVPAASASAAVPLLDGVRKLLLAGVGVVALSFDEAESFVNRLVERGEIAQKDGEKLLREVAAKLQRGTGSQVEKAEGRVETSIEAMLNRLNIPSKRDIDELSVKIAQLANRVEELRQAQTKKSSHGA